MDKHTNVVIIGGGCSGCLVLANLLRSAKQPIQMHLVERGASLGEGVAYSTKKNSHVLNVPSQGMSAFPDQPKHLLEWLQATGRNTNPLGFIARKDFAIYLRDTLEEAAKIGHASGASYQRHQAEAIDIVPDAQGWQVVLSNGDKLHAEQVVMASGIYLHDNQKRFIRNPWQIDFSQLNPRSNICLIGSGLSMVDMLFMLKEYSWTGKITVLAKNGAIPLAHRLASFSEPLAIDWQACHGLQEIFARFKQELRGLASKKLSWHSLIDSFRPHTQKLWQSFSDTEKKRFLRLFGGQWDQHRHRIAPEVHSQISELARDDFFTIHKAMVCDVSPKAHHVEVRFRQGGKEDVACFDYAVSCVGLESNYRRVKNPLIEQAFGRGLVQAGPLGRGILANDLGQIIAPSGEVSRGLYTLGFPQAGRLFESIAVPEIRMQAKICAQAILAQ